MKTLARTLCLIPALALAVPARAESFSPAQAERGPMLQIPGLPPVQMPPGSRVFGPNDRAQTQDRGDRGVPFPPRRPGQDFYRQDGQGSRPDRDAADAEERAKQQMADPKKPAAPPKTREEVLADLFNRLGKAKDVQEARPIAAGIDRMWRISGSDTADLLLSRATEAVRKKNFKLAIELYDKIVAIEPEWAEGWHQRATARFYQDDDFGAIEDIARTLALEPRHFSALTGLGFLLKRNEQKARALQAFKKSLEINPQQERVQKQIEELTLEVDGRGI